MKRTAGVNRALVVLCALGATVGAPTSASAADVRVDGGNLSYKALPGEANHPAQLHYDPTERRWTFFELPHFPSAGPGCELDSNPSTIYCEGSDEPLSARLELGDGNDWYQQTVVIEYNGLTGVTTEIPVEEPFSLTVNGGPGTDEFWADASGSPTSLEGGPDNDRFVFYTPRTDEPSTPPGTYRLLGGSGEDTMEVPWGATQDPPPGVGVTMEGGPDEDLIRGSKGADIIDGGEGSDHLWDLPGNDLVSGGAGDDQLYGGDGDDIVSGGEGNDSLLAASGSDKLDGGPGDDSINSKNLAQFNEVICGEGSDQVLPDIGVDVIATDCERIVIPEECGPGPACISTVKITTGQVPQLKTTSSVRRDQPRRRILLGMARRKFRGHSRNGRLPLSGMGRAYVEQRGGIRAVRTVRIVKPRGKKRPPKVRVTRVALILRAP